MGAAFKVENKHVERPCGTRNCMVEPEMTRKQEELGLSESS